MIRRIGAEDVIAAHASALAMDPSSDPGVPQDAREKIEGAIGNAYSAALYRNEADPILSYAAGILRNLETTHAFTDGNKKTAWIACAHAIEINGYTLEAPDVEVRDLCVRVLLEHLELDSIAEVLGSWLRVKDLPEPDS